MLVALSGSLGACKKGKSNDTKDDGSPRTNTPVALQGSWMYGNFSMTEYWSQNPADYLGNAFELAIAFNFNADGTYEQYFTSGTVSGAGSTYHQSLTKGTSVVNEVDKTITTYAKSAHYKQTRNGVTIEQRDLREDEMTKVTKYGYELRTEVNGVKVVYLKLNGEGEPLVFQQRF
jgi:hypothetical protein